MDHDHSHPDAFSTSIKSPIKTWVSSVRIHSPFRSRNKPLPPFPVDPPADKPQNSLPSRQPGQPVSGNVSPPKLNKKASQAKLSGHGGSSNGGPKGFIALLKHKASGQLRPASAEQAPSSGGETSTGGTAHETLHHSRNIFRSAGRSRTPDLRTLSRKVSNLEAALKEARRELDAVLSPSPDDDDDDEENHTEQYEVQTHFRPSLPFRTSSDEVNRQVAQHVESLSQRGRFDGLVETLLGVTPALHPSVQARLHTTASSSSLRPHLRTTKSTSSLNDRPATRRGPLDQKLQQYVAAEDAYEPVEVEYPREIEHPSPEQRQVLKRKHTEPEQQPSSETRTNADAGWREMQARVREFEAAQHKPQRQSEHGRSRSLGHEEKRSSYEKGWQSQDRVRQSSEGPRQTSERPRQSYEVPRQGLPSAKRVRWSTKDMCAIASSEDADELMTSSDHDLDHAEEMELAGDGSQTLTALPQMSPPRRSARNISKIPIASVAATASQPRQRRTRFNDARRGSFLDDADDDDVTITMASLPLKSTLRAAMPTNPKATPSSRATSAPPEVHITSSPASSPPVSIPSSKPKPETANNKRNRVVVPPDTQPGNGIAEVDFDAIAGSGINSGLSSARLSRVVEEFEWDDAEVF